MPARPTAGEAVSIDVTSDSLRVTHVRARLRDADQRQPDIIVTRSHAGGMGSMTITHSHAGGMASTTITAESGWSAGDLGYGPAKMAAARKAVDQYRAEQGLPPVEWDGE